MKSIDLNEMNSIDLKEMDSIIRDKCRFKEIEKEK